MNSSANSWPASASHRMLRITRASVVFGGDPRRSRGCNSQRMPGIIAPMRRPACSSFGIYPASDIKIGDSQRILLDKFTSLVDGFTHQGREGVVSFLFLIDRHLEEGPLRRVKGRFP